MIGAEAAAEGAMSGEHFDVLIVGAGLSGIGAGYHLQTKCPTKTYAILEARARLGGTWDLFRYPGVRSDSDMFTLGYSFKPWQAAKAIADGPSILHYINETAQEFGIDRKIRFGQRVTTASWSSAEAQWRVEAERADGEVLRYTCNFLFMCSGYYNYDAGYAPAFAGSARFSGRIVHPQQWTDDIDCAGKRVVVIGSGATAVTLVPALAETAAQVTMLQRSPTYIVARPAVDERADWLRRHLPQKLAYGLIRWRNVMFFLYIYRLCKRQPERMKRLILAGVRKALGPDYDVATHFTPRYNPWDQRLCLVPDGDLFKAIKSGRAAIVTEEIQTFTETGIRLRSGRALTADLVVTATGLDLVVLGKVRLAVDGQPVDPSRSMTYKGMMYSDVPNMAVVVGYTNASWTLKCDLTCAYVCRMLNYMDRHGYRQVAPRRNDPSVREEPWVDFSSGYIRRALDKFPKQGSKKPWRLNQNYLKDLLALRFGALRDRAIEYSGRRAAAKTEADAVSRTG
jgi:monooxygenase